MVRWDRAMPQYRVGHAARLQGLDRALGRQAPGVVLAGSSYHGIGIADCIRDGRAAADRAGRFLAAGAQSGWTPDDS